MFVRPGPRNKSPIIYDSNVLELFLKTPSIYDTREKWFLKPTSTFDIIDSWFRRKSHKRNLPNAGDNSLAKPPDYKKWIEQTTEISFGFGTLNARLKRCARIISAQNKKPKLKLLKSNFLKRLAITRTTAGINQPLATIRETNELPTPKSRLQGFVAPNDSRRY